MLLEDSIARSAHRPSRRLLLINAEAPPGEGQDVYLLYAPLGLLALKAALRESVPDVQVRLVDWNTYQGTEPEEHLGDILQDFRPSIVGISSFSHQMPWALRLAAKVKQVDATVPVLLGGHHATVNPDQVGTCKDFDYLVVGEAYRSGPALVSALLGDAGSPADVPGVAFRRGGRVVTTQCAELIQDLDQKTPVRWEDLELDRYFVAGDRTSSAHFMYTMDRGQLLPYNASEGCPHHCRFCERAGGNRIRHYSPDRVIQDLKRMIDTLGSRHIFFMDNYIHWDRAWFIELCRRLERDLDIEAMCLVLAGTLDRELIDRMMGAGIRYLACFPEAGSARIRRDMKKPVQLERLMQNMRYASDQGALVTGAFLMGWPTETRDEIESTLALAADPLFDLVIFNQLLYFRGSALGPYLPQAGIDVDSPAYYRHLSFPWEVCLAEYTVEEYWDYFRRGRNMNADKLLEPAVQAKLARIGMSVELLPDEPPLQEERPAPAKRTPRSILRERFGRALEREGAAFGPATVTFASQDVEGARFQVGLPDGTLFGFCARFRDRQRQAFVRVGELDLLDDDIGMAPRTVALRFLLAFARHLGDPSNLGLLGLHWVPFLAGLTLDDVEFVVRSLAEDVVCLEGRRGDLVLPFEVRPTDQGRGAYVRASGLDVVYLGDTADQSGSRSILDAFARLLPALAGK